MKIAIAVVIAVILLGVVGVGAYYAGTQNGLTQAQNIRAEFFQSRQGGGQLGQGGQGGQTGQSGQNGQSGQGQVGRAAANGTVKSVQGNTFEVTQRDGSTVTVTIGSQTQIVKTVTGAASDIKAGDNVTVLSDQTGTNVTARQIQLRSGATGQ